MHVATKDLRLEHLDPIGRLSPGGGGRSLAAGRDRDAVARGPVGTYHSPSMSLSTRLVIPLVLVLGSLTWVGSTVIEKLTRGWFERDLNARAELVVASAREALAGPWDEGDHKRIQRFLEEITRDERILASGACDASGADLMANTRDYPQSLACGRLRANLQRTGGWQPWHGVVADLAGGNVHVSAVPVADGERVLGFVVLLHDLRFVERRGAAAQRLLLFGFAILAGVASIITMVVARLSWRGWLRQVRRLLRGGPDDGQVIGNPEFKPIARDVRDLMQRIASDGNGAVGGRWTPERLKETLRRNLMGEKVILVANREPYIHEKLPDGGGIRTLHPASGLVTALEPVMRACSGVWIAHGAGSADRETADENGRVKVPPGEESFVIRRVWLSPEQEKGYYYGFSNEGLWPLCHLAHARPIFRADDWNYYQAVNRKFADAVVAEADSEDPIVLVQDYHFAMAPQMIRKRLPRATILTFWHIPWPNAERFGICPWRNEILEGLLGSSIVGFHTQLHCNNFMESVDRYVEARIDREDLGIIQQGRMTAVRAYPISIEWPNRWADKAPSIEECRRSVFAELGLAPHARLGVGVDRLDYTKGIEERFLAVEQLLERFPQFRGVFTFVQLAAPSRTEIGLYRRLSEEVEAVAARINARFGQARADGSTYQPIILKRAHHEPPDVFRTCRAADVCYVSSLHDGMNLVAKEFVAARDDERGALVLSHFTGASRELTEALIVNPYDLRQSSAALAAALTMSADEQRERMRAMRSLVAEYNVYRWAGRMIMDAARQRRRDRLSESLHEASHAGEPPRA